jgi:hypothetical protein
MLWPVRVLSSAAGVVLWRNRKDAKKDQSVCGGLIFSDAIADVSG